MKRYEVTDYVDMDVNGDFWVETMDFDTNEIICKPGDKVRFDHFGITYHGNVGSDKNDKGELCINGLIEV